MEEGVVLGLGMKARERVGMRARKSLWVRNARQARRCWVAARTEEAALAPELIFYVPHYPARTAFTASFTAAFTASFTTAFAAAATLAACAHVACL